MSRQWGRVWNLTLSGSDGSVSLSALKIVWQIKSQVTQTPATATFRIYNLSSNTANLLTQQGEFTKVSFSVGYDDNFAEIFTGQINYWVRGRENQTDTFLDITATHNDEGYNFAFTSKSLAKGSTPQDHLNEHVAAFSKYGISLGYTDPLPTFKYPRGVVLHGMTRDLLRLLAHSSGMVWSIQNDQVIMVKPGNSIPGDTIQVNSETGMVGMPTLTMEGVELRILLNPQMWVYRQIQINQAGLQGVVVRESDNSLNPTQSGLLNLPGTDADGLYTVVHIDANGDSRGQSWYMDLICRRKDALGGGPSSTIVPQVGISPGA